MSAGAGDRGRAPATQGEVDDQVEQLRAAGHFVLLGEFTNTAGCAFMGGVVKRTIERWRDEGRGPPVWEDRDGTPLYLIADCIAQFTPTRRNATNADIRRHSPVDKTRQSRKTASKR